MQGKRDWSSGGVAAVVGLSYLVTLRLGLPGGDAGELITVAAEWGVAHPPGYPLYTLLGRLFCALPFGTTAVRMALFSATCGAAATGFLFAALRLRTGSVAAALVGAVLFAWAPRVWHFSVGAEVFALNHLFAAVLLWLAARFDAAPGSRVAWVGTFLAGLGLCNHHTLIFLILPLVSFVLWRHTPLRQPAAFGGLVAAGLAGLLPYLSLPLAAARDQAAVYGDPRSLSGLWHHLLRRDYGTFQLAGDSELNAHGPGAQLLALGGDLGAETLALAWPLGLLGLWAALRGARPAWSRMLLLAVLLHAGVFAALANLSLDDPLTRAVTGRFWMLPLLLVSALSAEGFAWLEAKLPRPATLGLTALIVAAMGWWGARDQLPRDTDLVAEYGRAILEPLPPNTLLLVRGDLPGNALTWLQRSEGLRPDVIVLDQELLTRPWYCERVRAWHPELRLPGVRLHPASAEGFSLRALLAANAHRPRFAYPSLREDDPSPGRDFVQWPRGLAQEIHRRIEAPRPGAWLTESGAALDALGRRFDALPPFPAGSWEWVVVDDLRQARHRRGLRALELGMADPQQLPALRAARADFEVLRDAGMQNTATLLRNLALTYERLNLVDGTLTPQVVETWRAYLRVTPPGDPDRGAVEKTLRALERR